MCPIVMVIDNDDADDDDADEGDGADDAAADDDCNTRSSSSPRHQGVSPSSSQSTALISERFCFLLKTNKFCVYYMLNK